MIGIATKLEFQNYVQVQVGCPHEKPVASFAQLAEVHAEQCWSRARPAVTRRVANRVVDTGLACIAAALRFCTGLLRLLVVELLWPLAREAGCLATLGACCAAIGITRALLPHLLYARETLRVHSRLLHKGERSTALAMRGD